MIAHPMREPGEWHVFRVAGVLLPGIAKVTGCVKAAKLDVHDGSGTKGATVTYKGSTPKPFKVLLHILEEEDMDEWLGGEARRILMAAPVGKTSKSFAVDHPKCQLAEIGAALMQTIGVPEEVGDGSYTVEIELMPATPPVASSGTPSGSQTKWVDNPKTAKSEADAALAALEAQIKAETAKAAA